MSSDREQLISFGFDPARIDWALKATGRRGLQPALDHIIANEGNPVPDQAQVATGSGGAPTAADDDDEDTAAARAIMLQDQEAKSIKCSQCGKVFRNTAMAEFHAEKSGHDQFEESTEEIKPLTEEEKKERLAELKAKMAEKRAAKAQIDASDAKANEALRRKAGKDAGQIREDLKAKEAIKEAEQRKRDKIEAEQARIKIKAQIEADKKARAEKAAREKALREGTLVSAPAVVPAPAAATGSTNNKDHPTTRLQIRVTGGGTYTTTLESDKNLNDVAEYVASQTTAVDVSNIKFSTTFPRKIYTQADWSKTLKELGLAPSAVLMAGTT